MSKDTDSSVAVEHVSYSYPGSAFNLNDISLAIGSGSRFAIVGPNGCGKTTLLKIIGGHLAPDAGRILVGATDITRLSAASRPMVTVFQDLALFPHLNVRQNVAYGIQFKCHKRKAEALAEAETWLERFGLKNESGRLPVELSLGTQQRVAIARAIATGQRVILLDEPTSSLDTIEKRRLAKYILSAADKHWFSTMVMVSHDLAFASSLCDDFAILKQGELVAQGSVARFYRDPVDCWTAAYLDTHNVIPGQVDDQLLFHPTGLPRSSVSVPGDQQSLNGARCFALCRPDDIHLDPGGPSDALTLDCSVVDVRFRSCVVSVGVRCGDHLLRAELMPRDVPAAVRPGDTIPVWIMRSAFRFLPWPGYDPSFEELVTSLQPASASTEASPDARHDRIAMPAELETEGDLR